MVFLTDPFVCLAINDGVTVDKQCEVVAGYALCRVVFRAIVVPRFSILQKIVMDTLSLRHKAACGHKHK